MKFRNLHTSVPIIHLNSLKLVNDAPLISFHSMSHCIFSAQGRYVEIFIKHYYWYQLMIWKWETCILAWKYSPEFIKVSQWRSSYKLSVNEPLYFFCAWKVCWNCHQTLLLVSIDDMKVRNLHTRVEIICQNSSKLVNDAPLMSLQSASHCIFSSQGRYVGIGIKHCY